MNETHEFISFEKKSTEKILGKTWGIKHDEIVFNINDLVAKHLKELLQKDRH